MRTCNKENMKKVYDALMSGEYKQGKNALKQTGMGEDAWYCCLGVASELAAKEIPDLEVEDHKGSNSEFVDLANDHRELTYLPTSVMGWLGISTYNIGYDIVVVLSEEVLGKLDDSVTLYDTNSMAIHAPEPGLITRASYLNDEGVPFEFIAQAIKETYLED